MKKTNKEIIIDAISKLPDNVSDEEVLKAILNCKNIIKKNKEVSQDE